jgi:hypothetical protein
MSTNHALRVFVPSLVLLVAFVLTIPRVAASGQEKFAVPATPDACPIQISDFHPSATFSTQGVGLRVKNVTTKEVVGMVFDVALADAAENWKWLHWNFDSTRPLQDFGWNKPIKPGETKKLSWDFANLDFQHNGGGAFVLTSVLFGDGSGYQAPADNSVCKLAWYNGNKKGGLIRSVDLPQRE